MVTDHCLVVSSPWASSTGWESDFLHPPSICFSWTLQPPFGISYNVLFKINSIQIKQINLGCISKKATFAIHHICTVLQILNCTVLYSAIMLLQFSIILGWGRTKQFLLFCWASQTVVTSRTERMLDQRATAVQCHSTNVCMFLVLPGNGLFQWKDTVFIYVCFNVGSRICKLFWIVEKLQLLCCLPVSAVADFLSVRRGAGLKICK